MEGIFLAFALGTVWWWVVTLVSTGFLILAIDKESIVGSIFLLLFYISFLEFVSKANIFQFIADKPLVALSYVGGYIVIGLVWSFLKWWLYVHDKVDGLKEKRKEFLLRMRNKSTRFTDELREMEITEETKVPEGLRKEWQSDVKMYIPRLSAKKEKISIWIVHWPFSMLWSLVDDLIHKLAKRLVETFRKWYQAIADHALKGADIEGIE